MRERVLKFLENENLSSSRFADDIGVQRSTVSHILSGRNNPSFDFIQKILSRYKYLNAEWLIMGTGNMLKSLKQGSLFDTIDQESVISAMPQDNIEKMNSDEVKISNESEILEDIKKEESQKILKESKKQIEKIITFYTNKTFDIYFPA
jgi:transcriptional regulator with XRE-family HTH domain